MNAKRFLVLFFPLLLSVVGVAKGQPVASFAPQKEISENVVTNSSNSPQEAKMIPMLAIGNKWNTYEECDVLSTEPTHHKIGVDKTTYHYTIQREIEFDGKKYFEILEDNAPRLFMREDLNTGKVYARGNLDPESKEREIFDYNLKEGDVCVLYRIERDPIEESTEMQMKVISITNKNINGINRRVYQLAFGEGYPDSKFMFREEDCIKGDPFERHSIFNLTTGFWIEGIGFNQNIYGVQAIGLTGGYCTCEELLCFTDKSGTFERFSDVGCEVNYKVPRSAETPLIDKAKIYYHEGQLSLSLEDGMPHQLSIYDMSAQLIARKESFVGSVTVALPPAAKQSTILIRLDDETMLYRL
ncbi:hypothetical protein [Porphyromonas circumdentaria]|uniref:Uncharacterized protein n=1 Tax=Porphyromonas circumdentaria TaxID=29524 RepID=A0A1T4M4F3_9PORP|nr:hypothetical protein [Porphyromonas circumdentaria]MBB6275580.1 hypothetical protein [Porphyromonas circumdentaria]SJZ61802.1 hypothetical protein SAMN02745171_00627 [Porphyromonas circumdentaria]